MKSTDRIIGLPKFLTRCLAVTAATIALSACQLSPPGSSGATGTPPPAVPPPPPIAFDDAVLKAANELFSKAPQPAGSSARQPLVIDPLVDGVTGAQSAATRSMEQEIVDLVRHQHPRFEVEAFITANLAQQPLVLVGTFTPINNSAGQPTGERDAFRICLALADLKTGKVIAKGVARARPNGVDVAPLPFDADSPAWTRDPAVDGYIKTCQGSKAGDPINERLSVLRAQAIKDRLEAAAAKLAKRTIASGVGSRENLVGTGADDASDASDALDRRVEFKVIGC